MSKKILFTLDESQLCWLDDFRFAQRFESRSETLRWLLDEVRSQPGLPMKARYRALRARAQEPAG
jgi:Arc/MetJ-type ribon-helix-helix transcriptional regulator